MGAVALAPAKGTGLTLRSSFFRHIVMAENAACVTASVVPFCRGGSFRVNISLVGGMRREGRKTILEFVGSNAQTISVKETPEEILAIHLGEQRGS